MTPPSTSATIDYGDASDGSLRVVRAEHRRRSCLELRTEGFEARVNEDGTVAALPFEGFDVAGEPGSPRSAGEAHLARPGRTDASAAFSVCARRTSRCSRPCASRPSRLPSFRHRGKGPCGPDGEPIGQLRSSGARACIRGEAARVLEQGFQIDAGKALLELAPLRWDPTTGRLLLARRLVVRLALSRRRPASTARPRVIAVRGRRCVSWRTTGVCIESLSRRRWGGASRPRAPCGSAGRESPSRFISCRTTESSVRARCSSSGAKGRKRSMPTGTRRCTSSREAPAESRWSAASAATRGREPPAAPTFSSSREEENHLYQAALLKAEDPWLWDVLLAPVTKEYAFEVSGLVASSEPVRLPLRLQGASDFAADRRITT